jgi:hypothetical protein
MMNLVVHLPRTVEVEDSSALSLAQRAPTFTSEWADGERTHVAVFHDLPRSLDLAVQLIGESLCVPGAWASVNARPISSLTKLWQRLECYRESLAATDPLGHCTEKAAYFHSSVGCESQRYPVPCQFICSSCLTVSEGKAGMEAWPTAEAAVDAEIDWCPQLALSEVSVSVQQTGLLMPMPRKP